MIFLNHIINEFFCSHFKLSTLSSPLEDEDHLLPTLSSPVEATLSVNMRSTTSQAIHKKVVTYSYINDMFMNIFVYHKTFFYSIYWIFFFSLHVVTDSSPRMKIRPLPSPYPSPFLQLYQSSFLLPSISLGNEH